MLGKIVRNIFGSKNDRELKRMGKSVDAINAFADSLKTLDDEALQAKTAEFRERYSKGESLDDLLAESFAVVREAAERTLEMRHYDVQLIGGMSLHEGRIAEMRTGEGKTLVATLPAYLNALSGESVHVVTVNDYLANRDANWMRPLYEFLGMKVGVIYSQQKTQEKVEAYKADITYGTNNEFGFDFLRDNMALTLEDRVQRERSFAIVDEVDSILIDEARTPLIISGPAADSSKLYMLINQLMPKLILETEENVGEGHYTINEQERSVDLSENGHQYVESLLIETKILEEGESLYAPQNLNLLHHVSAALQAHGMFTKDVDYIIQNGEIVIVDEHTGRTMPGRRWGSGIHQAIEAKERVRIQNENQTLASTTFQNYFRTYTKLSGMTGTADTEAVEFSQIYGLDVVVIPTHKKMIRDDMNDVIYLTLNEKYNAIVGYIEELSQSKAPVLVGTASVESSELLSDLLTKKKIKHQVLNAKFHQKEAGIIADAGRPGAVTIATNMAGRGTDIVLGGNWQAEIDDLKNPTEEQVNAIKREWESRQEQVLAAGGLHIVGSERHESRRVDNQLRGRSGRQGDPGVTRFFLSLEDNLMRIFASDKVRNLMQGLGMKDGEAIEHRWVTRSIENAQRKVEGRNFDIRKSLLEYDDIANEQRKIIYDQRDRILKADSIKESVNDIFEEVINEITFKFMSPEVVDTQWEVEELESVLKKDFQLDCPVVQWLDQDSGLNTAGVVEKVVTIAEESYEKKESDLGHDLMRLAEKQLMMQIFDRHWKEHLSQMDHLRQSVNLRGYAAKNPKQEYKREAFELFQTLLDDIKLEAAQILLTIQFEKQEEVEELERLRREEVASQGIELHHDDVDEEGNVAKAPEETGSSTFRRKDKKVGRNEPCPCGSGKKYKQCHGKLG